MKDYKAFIQSKDARLQKHGFKPTFLPSCLMGFQGYLDEWAIELGRGAIYADCGLGKTLMQLVFAENCVRHANKPALIITPLAVSSQTVREATKFGMEAFRTQSGKVHKGINVTNYERLKNFNPSDFCCVVADESSILKNFDGKTRRIVTDFLTAVPYRLLCTATPSPNDHMELGTSAEALSVMSRNQMLGMFFRNDGESTQQWTLKGHARTRFWRWVSRWARAVRKPSDLGFPDGEFVLPPLVVERHPIKGRKGRGFLPEVAKTLTDQRAERRRSLRERCEQVAEVLPRKGHALVWCHMNDEGDLLTSLIPGAVQVAGKDRDEDKEERLEAFSRGEIRVLVTKPKIASFGLNWQHCPTMSFFPSHSHEQYYQAVRRCWRFGQKSPVTCHMVYTEAESRVLSNMLRKERQAEELYTGIVREMNGAWQSKEDIIDPEVMEVPPWLI